MKLPYADEAIVDLRKLREYCLNPEHPRGKHKARVFQDALGLGREDAAELGERILKAILVEEAERGTTDAYGTRFTADFTCERHGKSALIRSCWIVKKGEHAPRLTSCYVI